VRLHRGRRKLSRGAGEPVRSVASGYVRSHMVAERLGISLELDEPGDRGAARAYANLALRAVAGIETSAAEAKKAAAAALTASGYAAEARRAVAEGARAIGEVRGSLANIEAHLGLVQGLPTVAMVPAPPPGARPPSHHDFEEVKDQVEELADDFEAFKKEATNPGLSKTPSDPAEAAKKVGVGVVILGWRGLRRGTVWGAKFAAEHWKEIGLALMAGGHLPWLVKVIGQMPAWAQHLIKP